MMRRSDFEASMMRPPFRERPYPYEDDRAHHYIGEGAYPYVDRPHSFNEDPRLHVDRPHPFIEDPRLHVDRPHPFIEDPRLHVDRPHAFIEDPRLPPGHPHMPAERPPYGYAPPPGVVGPPPPFVVDTRPFPPTFHDELVRGERRPRKSKKDDRQRSPSRSKSRKGLEDGAPLSQWSDWRTGINNKLGKDLVRNTFKPIPVGEDFDELVRPSSKSKKGVYRYATTIDQATQLHKEDFVNFGIPRAQISGTAPRPLSPGNISDKSDDSDETDVPFYSINKLPGQVRLNGAHPAPDRNGYGREESREGRHRRRDYRPASPDVIIDNHRARSYYR